MVVTRLFYDDGECGGVFTWTLTCSAIYSARMSEAIQSALQEHIPQRIGEKHFDVPLISG